jgi:hypothetical protein
MKGLTNAVGTVTILVVLVTAFGAGVFNGVMAELVKTPQPLSKILLGGWQGFVGTGAEVEGIVCNQDGENCRWNGGDE